MNTLPVIDVHGLTAQEAIRVVSINLKEFYNQGFPDVHIIHGNGQGILKQNIRSLLNTLGYVKSFRAGKHNEGKDGVTVAIFID